MRDKAYEAMIGLADTLGQVAKAEKIKALTVVVDPADGMARCEFMCSDEDLAKMVSAVFTTAARLLPVDQIGALIERVQGQVAFNLFDPRGPAYRPSPRSAKPSGKRPRKGRK